MLKALLVSTDFCDTWHTQQGCAKVTPGENAQNASKVETKKFQFW